MVDVDVLTIPEMIDIKTEIRNLISGCRFACRVPSMSIMLTMVRSRYASWHVVVSRAWQVPRSTLKLRIDGKVEGSGHMSGRKTIFDSGTEDKLVSAIKELSQRGLHWE